MAQLNHERVVKLLGVIMEDRDCSLVMELIPRGNLMAMLERVSGCNSSAHIEEEKMNSVQQHQHTSVFRIKINQPEVHCLSTNAQNCHRSQVLVPVSIKGRIILEILEGMVYLTEKRVIHKDIKPENILVDKDFHIKVYYAYVSDHDVGFVHHIHKVLVFADCRPRPGHLPDVEQAHEGGVSQEESRAAILRRKRRRYTELHGPRAPGEYTHTVHREVRRL